MERIARSVLSACKRCSINQREESSEVNPPWAVNSPQALAMP